MSDFNPFKGKNFPFWNTFVNPFDLIKNDSFKAQNPWLENVKQIPGLENYINDLFGQNFLQQQSGSREIDATEIFETLDEVIIKVKLPGIQKVNDLKISLQGLNLILEAILEDRNMENNSDGKLIKRFKLPTPVTTFGSKAVYNGEIVEVKLQKQRVTQIVEDIHVQFL